MRQPRMIPNTRRTWSIGVRGVGAVPSSGRLFLSGSFARVAHRRRGLVRGDGWVCPGPGRFGMLSVRRAVLSLIAFASLR